MQVIHPVEHYERNVSRAIDCTEHGRGSQVPLTDGVNMLYVAGELLYRWRCIWCTMVKEGCLWLLSPEFCPYSDSKSMLISLINLDV